VTGAISEDNRDEALGERDSARAVLEAAQKTVTARERSVVAAQALVNQTDAQIVDTILWRRCRAACSIVSPTQEKWLRQAERC
jgi:hypothetical protein